MRWNSSESSLCDPDTDASSCRHAKLCIPVPVLIKDAVFSGEYGVERIVKIQSSSIVNDTTPLLNAYGVWSMLANLN